MALKIAMLEPHGSGGICHYTHELMGALSSQGVELCLFTNDVYELRGLATAYPIESYSSSHLKKLLRKESGRKITPDSGGAAVGHTNKPDYKKKHVSRFAAMKQSMRTSYMFIELLVRIIVRRVNIIHIQWLEVDQKGPRLVLRLAKLFGKKIFYTAHNILPHDDARESTKKSMRAVYHLVDKIIVHSEVNKDELMKVFQVSSDKIHVIPHGNYGFFDELSDQPDSTADLRAELSIDNEAPVILFFGSIQKYKGLDVLLSAFQQVHEERPDIYLLIAGKLTPYEGKDQAYFINILSELGIKDVTHLNVGYVPMAEVSRYFRCADAVVLPYLKTYTSGIIQLAYAFGKPVIATNTGDLQDVVLDNVSGYVVSTNSETELADAILKLFQDRETRAKMGKEALRLAEGEFSWESIAEKTIYAYENELSQA